MKSKTILVVIVCLVVSINIASADIFGTGENQFAIDFVIISGDSGDLGSWPAGIGYTFSGVNHSDYRIGTYEITNEQWTKFKNSLGLPITGNPSTAYDSNPYWTNTNVPTNCVSWYEAAQFVNWLNTSNGHQAAYKFTGTQGTGDYAFDVWESGEIGYDASNPYRNGNAYYFLPTEDEWIKAAYWNGTNLQTYATVGDTVPVAAVDTNYNWPTGEPWNVGSGYVELNGTFDMMGNVLEWMENPYNSEIYTSTSDHGLRGGSFSSDVSDLCSSDRIVSHPSTEAYIVGFRVASIPEPATLLLFGLGAVVLKRKR